MLESGELAGRYRASWLAHQAHSVLDGIIPSDMH